MPDSLPLMTGDLPTSYARADALLRARGVPSLRLWHGAKLTRDSQDGSIGVHYRYGVVWVRFFADGSMRLDTGGKNTRHVRAAINRFLPSGWRVGTEAMSPSGRQLGRVGMWRWDPATSHTWLFTLFPDGSHLVLSAEDLAAAPPAPAPASAAVDDLPPLPSAYDR